MQPTELKKPHRRNLSISPSRPIATTSPSPSSTKPTENETSSLSLSAPSYRLRHVHSLDQYVNMTNQGNYVTSTSTIPSQKRDQFVLQRGKSEEFFERKYRQCQLEPIAITEIYDDACVKKSNPKRRLKRSNEMVKHLGFSCSNEPKNRDICPPPTVQQAENLISQTIQLLNQVSLSFFS